jgi:hypothetical protein
MISSAASLHLNQFQQPLAAFLRQPSIKPAPDAQGIGPLQFVRQRFLGEILEAYGPRKAQDGLRSYRREARIGSRRIRAAMNHGVTDLYAGGIAVENDSADFLFQNRHQVCRLAEVFLGAVNGGREMTFHAIREAKQLLTAAVTNHHSRRSK